MQRLLTFTGAGVSEIFQPVGLKNLIINGNLDVWQRGNSFVSANGYTADRFFLARAGTMTGNVTQHTDNPGNLSPVYSDSCLRIQITTAQTVLGANDSYSIRHIIEGYLLRLIYNQPFTLSFWVKASITGTYCIGIRNADNTYSYVDEYVITAANTWEKKVIVIPAPPSDFILNYQTDGSLKISWTIAAGSALQTTPKAWKTGNFIATNKQVNAAAAVSEFLITQIQLEPGIVATELEVRPYPNELRLCQRYYSRIAVAGAGYAHAAGVILYFPITFPELMRVTPTCALVGATGRSNASAAAVVPYKSTFKTGYLSITAAAVGLAYVGGETWEANADY